LGLLGVFLKPRFFEPFSSPGYELILEVASCVAGILCDWEEHKIRPRPTVRENNLNVTHG